MIRSLIFMLCVAVCSPALAADLEQECDTHAALTAPQLYHFAKLGDPEAKTALAKFKSNCAKTRTDEANRSKSLPGSREPVYHEMPVAIDLKGPPVNNDPAYSIKYR